MRRPTRWDAFWVAYFVAGFAVEIRNIRRHNGVLTDTTKLVFMLHTRPGRLAWALGWSSATAWVWSHMLQRAAAVAADAARGDP